MHSDMDDLDLNKGFVLHSKLERIVSTVPSQTELLFDLGLGDKIAGITKFCVLPKDKTSEKIKVGGTKNLDLEKIKQLQPDLIIAGKEENTKEQIEELKKHFPVWITDVTGVDSALQMILDIARITGAIEKGKELVSAINRQFEIFANHRFPVRKSLYFIWRNPYMVAANKTFINSLMERTGFDNAAKNLERYPVVDEAIIKKLNPELILLCSEPYRFGEKHIHEFKRILPDAKVIITDGQAFAWYGSRLLHSIPYITGLHQSLIEN